MQILVTNRYGIKGVHNSADDQHMIHNTIENFKRRHQHRKIDLAIEQVKETDRLYKTHPFIPSKAPFFRKTNQPLFISTCFHQDLIELPQVFEKVSYEFGKQRDRFRLSLESPADGPLQTL